MSTARTDRQFPSALGRAMPAWAVLGVLLVSVPGVVRAQNTRQVELTHPSHVRPGDVLRISVDVDEVVGLASFRLEIAFDESIFDISPSDVRRGDLFPSGNDGLTVANFLSDETLRTPGELIVSAVNVEPVTRSGAGSILTLDLRVRADTEIQETFVDLQDARLNELELELVNPPVPGPDPSDSSCVGTNCDPTNVTIAYPEINVEPSSLSFGEIVVGQSVERTFEVSNAGEVSLAVSSIDLTGDTTAEFIIIGGGVEAGGDPVVLSAGDDARLVTVRYTPTASGADNGRVRVVSDAADAEILVSLSGSAVLPDSEILVSEEALAFGDLLVGESEDRQVQITNPGEVDLEIRSIAFTASTSSEYRVVSGAVSGDPVILRPGAPARVVTIRYTPVDAGRDSGELQILSDAGDNEDVRVSLDGRAELPVAVIGVEPRALDFGEIAVDEFSERDIAVTSSGNGTLEVEAPRFVVGTSSEFSIVSGGGSFSIAPGGPARTIRIRYTPVDGGADEGVLLLSSNAGEEPVVEVALGGSAIAGTAFRRGDADDNSRIELTDAIKILAFLFQGGSPPTCDEAADADDNSRIELTDAIRVLAYLFQGGPPPPAPGPGDCGLVPAGSVDSGCERYTSC